MIDGSALWVPSQTAHNCKLGSVLDMYVVCCYLLPTDMINFFSITFLSEAGCYSVMGHTIVWLALFVFRLD